MSLEFSADAQNKIAAACEKYPTKRPVVMAALHLAQKEHGHLSDEVLQLVARTLDLPYAHVYGVATFYNYFSLKPQGEHTCVICLGTACYIKGSGALLSQLETELGIKVGETTPDGKISLLAARCIGSCGLAPAGVFDGAVSGKMESAPMMAHVAEWRSA
mgnify:CR=1 FL=1